MSETCSTFKPLPFRRQFWRTLPKRIREGVVLLGSELAEWEDNRNAAQSILIDYIEREMMANFVRPPLLRSCDFYAAFFVAYQREIRATEIEIWADFGREFEAWSAAEPAAPLDEKRAAYLTYAFRPYPEPPESQELYMNLAVYARAYEYLLRKRYGRRYSNELFYRSLREHFPVFLLKFIGMDSAIGALISRNLHTKETVGLVRKMHALLMRYSFYEVRFFVLGEDDSFAIKPAFIKAIHEHAEEHQLNEDHMGRTEDRGCPFLFTTERKAILDFAINELVEQHRTWFAT